MRRIAPPATGFQLGKRIRHQLERPARQFLRILPRT